MGFEEKVPELPTREEELRAIKKLEDEFLG